MRYPLRIKYFGKICLRYPNSPINLDAQTHLINKFLQGT